MTDFDELIDKITAQEKRLMKLPPSKGIDDAIFRLEEVKAELATKKREELAGLFEGIAAVLRAEAKKLGSSPFEDALEGIGELIGLVTEEGSGTTEAGGETGLDSLEKLIKELLDGVIEQTTETPVYQPPQDQPGFDKTGSAPGPSTEQERLISAIGEMSGKYGMSEGLLGAVAWIESGLRSVKSASSSATGPFQFLAGTWAFMVRQFGAKTNIGIEDIGKVEAQAEMAAIAFRGYRDVLRTPSDEPTNAALYLCHFLGPAAAKECLSGDLNLPIGDALRSFYSGKSQGAGFADKVLKANPQLFRNGVQLKVAEVLEYYRAKLLLGEAKYRQLALHVTAAAVPAPVAPAPPSAAGPGADPPWLAIAKSEMAKEIFEIKGDEHNPEILKYLASTTIASDPSYMKDETAWCAAFVNWCLKQAGIKGANSAKARDWYDCGWGHKIDAPVIGCITVLWRERVDHPERLGHIGFYMGEKDGGILLLGGNQKDAASGKDTISVGTYSKERLLSYRMP